jgi:hypothetical protein
MIRDLLREVGLRLVRAILTFGANLNTLISVKGPLAQLVRAADS